MMAATEARLANAADPDAGENKAHAAGDWSLGLDLGFGNVITAYATDSVDGGSAVLTGLRLGYGLSDDWTAQLVLDQRWLPNANHATTPGLGLRFRVFDLSFGLPYIEASAGPTFTKNGTSFGYNAGLGLEINIASGLGLGPFARYGEAINPDPLSSNNGRSWELGIAATLHFRAARAAVAAAKERQAVPRPRPMHLTVPDTDHDHFTNDVDQCPDVPAGPHPDPMRPGCPEPDEDNDGVPDNDDVCPMTPAGDNPDKKRPGCPFSDRDNDGIADADDACPDQPGEASPDPKKNGCPKAEPKAPRPAPAAREPETPEGIRPTHKKRTRSPSPGFNPQTPPPPP
jgi:hypothetical protein